MKLQGKVAMVTGGGSGIGEAVACRLAEEGASVAVVDIDGGAATLTVGLMGGGHAIAADVSDSAAVDGAVAEVEEVLGPLDVLVNVAGIPGRELVQRILPRMETQLAEAASGSITTPLESLVRLSDEEWARMLAVHLNGTFYCTRAAARVMAQRKQGVIVNVASICGIEGCAGVPHYSAAKGGILAFTRAVAKELILQGIRVNAVAPGYVDTPMLETLSPLMVGAVQVQTPIGRVGTPTEIAATVAFLTSDEATFFVGDTLSPNGGYVTV